MSRYYLLFACLITLIPMPVAGAGGHHHHRQQRHRQQHVPHNSNGHSTSFGLTYGGGYSDSYYGYSGFNGYSGYNGMPYYGYVNDPYRSGHFQAPDLLEDPYFRAQHKFDSHFPGRHSRQPMLQLRAP